MSKRLIFILALAFVVGFAFAAYAEVQNVKVSGDLTIKGVTRENLDLNKTDYSTTPGTAANVDEQDNFLSIIRLRVDADLTDNVSTTVRLINERDWDGEDTATTEANNIEVDLAYVALKEFLYSPLSLTLGRQELRYGNGLVVGDPDTNNLSAASNLTQSDLSLRKAFDAMKAVLNYDPLVIDLVYAKIDENTIAAANANDDTDLYGINANYALNKETTLEGYLFSKRKGSDATQYTIATGRTTAGSLTVRPTKHDTVHTAGVRVVNTSIKNLSAQLESAFQFGTYNPGFDISSRNAADTASRRAWALQAIANYDLKDIVPARLSKYKPSLTGTYTYLSGEKNTRVSGVYHGWDAMYEDQTLGHLVNRLMGYSNSQIIGLSGKIIPIEDVTLNLDYAYYWLNKKYPDNGGSAAGFNTANLRGITGASTYRMTGSRNIGQEIDATLTYDYTEDVQFSLLGGLFLPGSAFQNENDTRATEIIGSMKVTF